VGFYREENKIYGANRPIIVGSGWVSLKVPVWTPNVYALGLHTPKVRATSDEVNFLPRQR